MPDGGAAQLPVFQIIPSGDDVSTGNFPKLIRPLDAGKLHKILKRIAIGTSCLRIIDIGKPFDFLRHLSEMAEVGGAQKPTRGRNRGGKIG